MCNCENKNPNPTRCICRICQEVKSIVQPYYLGKKYVKGDKAVSDNTLYVCILSHTASPEIFVGDPLYWVADYGDLPIEAPTTKQSKAKAK